MSQGAPGPYLDIVEELEVTWSLRGPLDGLPEGHGTGSALRPVGAADGIEGARRLGYAADELQLRLGVRPAGRGQSSGSCVPVGGSLWLDRRAVATSGSLLESVDGDHHGNPKESGVLNLLLHVTTALLQQPQVLHTNNRM